MSLKGKTFTVNDLPPAKRQRMGEEAAQRWADENTERYRIVARDPVTDAAIIAEELEQRGLNRLSSKARRIAGAMMLMDVATRREIIAAFDADGALKSPFRKV